MQTIFSSIETVLEDLKYGKMIVLVDDEARENEGDLVVAAEYATVANINFMIQKARGLVCLTLTEEHAERMQLPLMVKQSNAKYDTAFTV